LVVFSDLEARLLKTRNLGELMCGVEPGAMPLVYAENTTHEDRLVL